MAYFNPQGPRGPRPFRIYIPNWYKQISTHKALAGLDRRGIKDQDDQEISTHKALAGLDGGTYGKINNTRHFNPQGPRGPRHNPSSIRILLNNFNPQGPRGPRQQICLTFPPHSPIILCIFHFSSSIPPFAPSATAHTSIHLPGLSGANLPDISCPPGIRTCLKGL